MCQFQSPEKIKPLFFSVMRCFMVFLRLNETKSVQSRMQIQFRMALPFDRLFTRRIGKILICGANMEESVGFSLVESRNMSVFFIHCLGEMWGSKVFFCYQGTLGSMYFKVNATVPSIYHLKWKKMRFVETKLENVSIFVP